MLTLVTGTPGAGKTLNTIKQVLADEKQAEKDNLNRAVYYFNIRGVKIDHWIELSKEELLDWEKLPSGSIIIADEAQSVFPQRGPKAEIPLHIAGLNTHRHLGIDFYIITQHARMLDVAVRRLIGRHFHYDRRFGSNTVNRYMFNTVEEDPKNLFKEKGTIRESVTLDKEIFDLYDSAEVHTHKRKYPLKIIAAVVFFLLIPIGAYFGISNLNISEDEEVAEESTNKEVNESELPIFSQRLQPTNRLDRFKPRIEGLPHTAPIYDEVQEPVTYPRYNCVFRSKDLNSCKCYTQQATLMDTTVAVCLSIVERGLFDPARPDPSFTFRTEPDESPQRDTRAGSSGGNRFVLINSDSNVNRNVRLN